MSTLECVGCGVTTEIASSGTLCYTCGCGATFFLIDGNPAPPASFVMAVQEESLSHKKVFGHIDYYLGTSNHQSIKKEALIEYLRKMDAVWSWECDECKHKFLFRKISEIDYHLLDEAQLHPDLLKLIVEFRSKPKTPML